MALNGSYSAAVPLKNCSLILLLRHAPLRVRSDKLRHQFSEWMILDHIDHFIQGEVLGFQVLMNSL